ncbi:MAG: hypothetical protein ACYCSF_01970 [Acidimicrobiales bacterium]
MPSTPRATWRRISMSLAQQVSAEVGAVLDSYGVEIRERLDPIGARLDRIEAQLVALTEEVHELRDIAGTHVDVANEATDLLGRLIRSATSRLDELEERASSGR